MRAAVGGMVWAGVVVLAVLGRGPFWLLEPLFLLAPLVLAPRLLELTGAVRGAAGWGVVAAAISAAGSFLLPRGPAAGALAGVWAAACLALALHALLARWRRALRDPAELALLAGTLFLPGGAAWLVASRLGARPLGFEEPLVLLTAIHLHFAGFTASTLVGQAGRRLGGSRAYQAIVAGTVTGTPLLALGITYSPRLEMGAAALLAAALGSFGLWLLRRLQALPPGAARTLLRVSALALLPSMLAALSYAVGEFTGQAIVALSWMARVHGVLNALVFGLGGAIGWTLDARNSPPSFR